MVKVPGDSRAPVPGSDPGTSLLSLSSPRVCQPSFQKGLHTSAELGEQPVGGAKMQGFCSPNATLRAAIFFF